ncbi:uncharacterized protein M421DRAFT_101319 [Didymella exigua CBS 183.55]|uniref:Uncharacterized protein n=1 Tax=Didymella exigua CBS 183.55 TaxID=1150837 RepID=A0A6A5RLQ9_9PLEO|nr:uncharacterized protein M421DRAFT_101319 [Didymella exigua CBS 183.55]KAF1927914.1 hypothetical protein M421DRAFT_101319 [Didymella exigua CBS 183.55]
MSWFLRGVQSAIFHYASCAPCTGYNDSRKRRREAKRARKAREKLVLEQPETYYHPEPTGTNPFWDEEIALGPGPPSRRARRTNTGSTRCAAKAGLQSAVVSQSGSSVDGERARHVRLSDDSLDDDTWNLKRYQREDEHLWGLDEAPVPVHQTTSASSSSGTGSMLGLALKTSRPGTSRSGSYYSARAPPVNELHPPVVSLPSSDVADNRWMLQPPPKASVMAGRERATHRSRSGSGASSRVELSLQRHVSTRQLMHRLERGQTHELPSMTPHGSYTDLVSSQRRNRSRTPQARPPSSTSSRKRLDTANTLNRTDTTDSQHSVVRGRTAPTAGRTTPTAGRTTPTTGRTTPTAGRTTPTAGRTTPTTGRTVSVRQSRPALSTVVSSGSGANASPPNPHHSDENALPGRPEQTHHGEATRSTDSLPAPRIMSRRERAPLSSSDISSLNCLQDTVSPRALLSSRFVSAPLVEAKIRLPLSNGDLAASARDQWNGSGFAVSRGWSVANEEPMRAPFDSHGVVEKDPRLRWSVDF